jgi:hypothetical protein
VDLHLFVVTRPLKRVVPLRGTGLYGIKNRR